MVVSLLIEKVTQISLKAFIYRLLQAIITKSST